MSLKLKTCQFLQRSQNQLSFILVRFRVGNLNKQVILAQLLLILLVYKWFKLFYQKIVVMLFLRNVLFLINELDFFLDFGFYLFEHKQCLFGINFNALLIKSPSKGYWRFHLKFFLFNVIVEGLDKALKTQVIVYDG
jgi:hypothetical protein